MDTAKLIGGCGLHQLYEYDGKYWLNDGYGFAFLRESKKIAIAEIVAEYGMYEEYYDGITCTVITHGDRTIQLGEEI